jgi:ribosomal protein S1
MQTNENSRKAPQHRNSSQDTPKWDAARAANTTNSPVNAKVDSVATKDGRPRGLNVTLELGLPSFIPGSELPKGISQNALVGQTISVKVIEVNRRKGRLISSLKSLADEQRTALLSSLSEGQEITGTVARITEFGYFVELGSGVDALLHISQTALVNGQPEVLTKGQQITAKVRSVSVEDGKVALTMRKPRPENSGNGRRNVDRFNDRHSARKVSTAIASFKTSIPAPKADKPKGPRKLNNTTPKSKKAGFQVVFTSEGGNPFEQLAAWHAQKDETAPIAEVAPAAEVTGAADAQ